MRGGEGGRGKGEGGRGEGVKKGILTLDRLFSSHKRVCDSGDRGQLSRFDETYFLK